MTNTRNRKLSLVFLTIASALVLVITIHVGLKATEHSSRERSANVMTKTSPPTTFSSGRNITSAENSPFVRAVLLYVRVEDDSGEIGAGLRWFYRSWKEMLETQPSNWRTDIVFVSEKRLPAFDRLNCSSVRRKNALDPNACRFCDNYQPELVGVADLPREVRSVHILAWEGVALDAYDYILRTDVDTFLTPGFAAWRPRHTVVSDRKYIFSDDYITSNRLRRIALNLHLNYQGLNNVGLTWYGPTPLLRRAASLFVDAVSFMRTHEFTHPARTFDIAGPGKNWPDWHYGVLSLYGGHLAINHLARDYEIEINKDQLDYDSRSKEKVDRHAHIHAEHGEETFSTSVFLSGGYDKMDVDALPKTTCKHYCLHMALDSKRLYT